MSLPKYAQLEIERRWLVDANALGLLDTARYWDIDDLYIHGTRLRLRKMESSDSGIVYKLCKKYGKQSAISEPISNIYLAESEYALLLRLPGTRVHKRRYRIADGGVDIFADRNPGLAIYEVEFQDEESAENYTAPGFALKEVTGDEDYDGLSLAGGGGFRSE